MTSRGPQQSPLFAQVMKNTRGPKRSYGSWTTARDVAKLAGVSVITVSRAFSAPKRVAPKTLEKVMRVAKELGYHPNAAARDLSSRRSRVVATVVPTLSNSNFARTIEGLTDGLMPKADAKHRKLGF